MSSAFLSHSHHDRSMARRLHAALVEAKKEVWADWEDIAPASVFQRDLDDGVAKCDALVFLISPDSVKSQYCRAELERASELHKRIVPVVHRPVESDDLPHELSERNWVPGEGSVADDFDRCVHEVVEAIDADPEWTHEHTRLGNYALDWDAKHRSKSLRLRGEELEQAERWLAGSRGKSPEPTELQREYIRVSRQAATRGRRLRIGASGSALLVAAAVGVVTLVVVPAENRRRDEREYLRAVDQLILPSQQELARLQAAFLDLDSIARGRPGSVRSAVTLAGELGEALGQRKGLSVVAGLRPPPGLAQDVQFALVETFERKQDSIRAIQRCLPLVGQSRRMRAAMGTCLAATKRSSDVATRARQKFIRLYNRLRRKAGLEPVIPSF